MQDSQGLQEEGSAMVHGMKIYSANVWKEVSTEDGVSPIQDIRP